MRSAISAHGRTHRRHHDARYPGRDTIDARGQSSPPGSSTSTRTDRRGDLSVLLAGRVTTALELELAPPTSRLVPRAKYRRADQLRRLHRHIKVRMVVLHDPGTRMPVGDGAYRAATPTQIGEIAQRIEIGLREGAVDIGAGFPTRRRRRALSCSRCSASPRERRLLYTCTFARASPDSRKPLRSPPKPTPIACVHINSAGLAETPVMLEMIGAALAHRRNVTTEAYPYDAGMTEIQSAIIQDVYKSAPTSAWPSWSGRLRASG